jgi:hypothetical protein
MLPFCLRRPPAEPLAPAQSLEDENTPIILDTIRECLSIYHHGVIDTEIHMPTQRPVFIEHVIGESRGDLVDRIQDLGDGAGRHRYRAVLQLRKKPVKMSRHYNRRHNVQPNRTE